MASYLDVVIPAFIDGREKNSKTLRAEATDENGVATLFSYSTEIAYRMENGHGIHFYVNPTKYSATTRRQQRVLTNALRDKGYSPNGESLSLYVYTRTIFYQASPVTRTTFEKWVR